MVEEQLRHESDRDSLDLIATQSTTFKRIHVRVLAELLGTRIPLRMGESLLTPRAHRTTA